MGTAYLSAVRGPRPSLRHIALVTTGRTGSELLVQLLDSHPDIHCDSEVLDNGPDFPRLFLRGRAADAARHGSSVYGFKFTANQMDWPIHLRHPRLFFDDLEHAGFLFVRLHRRDRIRQAISHERAKALGQWHNASPDASPDLCPADVIHTLVWLEQHDARLDDALAGRLVHELVYEDDLATPEQQRRTAALLYDLLFVPVHQPLVRVRRSSHDSTSEMVGNWSEISAAIDLTRFRPLLATIS